MPQSEDEFQSHDGLRLHEFRWLPDGDARAVVVLLHGFIEHAGRYADLAAELNRAGYAVYAPDHRGHGRSEGDRVFVRSVDEYLADARLYLQQVRHQEPDRPLFLLGHSLGGTIAALMGIEGKLEADLNVAGLVLSAPAVVVGAGVFPLLRRAARLLARWFPKMRVVRMGSGMLSRDRQVVAEFRSDPFVFHERFPVRTGAEILDAADRVRQGAQSIRLPLLVLQGTGDWVVDPNGGREVYAQAGSTDKTLKLYEGLYHDLFHEPEKALVTADLIGWMQGERAVTPSR